jgi:glycosyltransferase involved in cell wall biosynthesis
VDRYIALTHFAAGRLSAGGLPADRITVKPNFLPEPPVAGDGLGGYAIYVGRLSNEKGVRTLVEAWREPGLPPLRLLGDGPLRSELETQISQQRLPIEIMGNRPRPEVLSQVGGACLQIIPSECYEGFPMVILEALAKGTPLVVSRIGSINEIVEDDVTGVKFSPGDPTGLARCVRDLAGNPTRLSRLREQARKCFEDHYTGDKNLERILAIYRSVV